MSDSEKIAPSTPATISPAPLPRRARGRGGSFLLQRVGFYVVTAWVALTLNFLIPRFMPGDPAQALALQITRQTGAQLTPEMLDSIRTLYGDPNANLLEQYLSYLSSIVTGDFGIAVSR